MAFKLIFTLPNKEPVTIPIIKVKSNWNPSTLSFYYPSRNDFVQYDNNYSILDLLDVEPQPANAAANYRTEIWNINGVNFSANIYKKNEDNYFSVNINNNNIGCTFYSTPNPFDALLSPATLKYLNCWSRIAYDYNSNTYPIIGGYENLEPINISSAGIVNLMRAIKNTKLFADGNIPQVKEIKNGNVRVALAPNVIYMASPTNMFCGEFTGAGLIRTAQLRNNNMFTRIINKINAEAQNNPNVIPVTPPKYPDNPDDPENPDDDPTDPTPGTGDGTSDPIPVPPKPTIDVIGTGFVTLYNPSALEIRDLAYFMWSGDFADLLKKIFRAPFDCLISLKLLYVPITTGAAQTIWLGNVETTVSAPKITEQFVDFDCGELQIIEYFGSFLDYTPYTKITIFLPFIGYKQLSVDEIMNSTLHLTYRIDVYTGACIAFLKVTKFIKTTKLNSVLYSFDGNCAMDIPFTAGDMTRYIAAILGTAASTAGAVISNPMPSEAPLNTETDATKNLNEKHLSDLGNTSANLVASKPQIQRSGSLAGANSSMGIKTPYIIIERPLQQMPYNYPNYIGIPLNMTKTLTQVKGFTVISDIFMASSLATDEEIKMITSKLKQGVVL